MRRLIPLLLVTLLAIPSIAAASSIPSQIGSGGTRWALFGFGKNHSQKAAKSSKASKSTKAPKAKKSKH